MPTVIPTGIDSLNKYLPSEHILRVVQFIDSLRSGGTERQVLELLKRLSILPEIDCHLIILSENIHYSYVSDLNVEVHKLVRRFKKDPHIFLKVYGLLKKIGPDIIHSWNSMCSIYALPAAKLLGIKFVNGFLRNVPPNFFWGHDEWIRSRVTFPFSDAIVANSRAALAAYKCPIKRSCFIHNGFDFNRIKSSQKKAVTKDKLEIATRYCVGMVATFSKKKDYLTYIDAAVSVLNIRKDVTFIAVGDGGYLEVCKNRVPENLAGRIIFLGKIKGVESLINMFDIGVLTTNACVQGEGISNSIMEYMAFGKPVVATDCGGNRELVIDGQTGFLVGNGDSGSLSRSILALLSNEKLAKRLGDAGRERLRKYFDIERMTQNHVALYRALL